MGCSGPEILTLQTRTQTPPHPLPRTLLPHRAQGVQDAFSLSLGSLLLGASAPEGLSFLWAQSLLFTLMR